VASLIVLRGNSGSGKSTIASLLQQELGALAAVLSQDHFCRAVYREPDQRGMAHAQLMEAAAKHCLAQGHTVILDGIFNASRYSRMLQRIAQHSSNVWFYAFDLDFEQTALRHESRAKVKDFSSEEMRGWYHGWQPLNFVDEQRITAEEGPEEIVHRILDDLSRGRA